MDDVRQRARHRGRQLWVLKTSDGVPFVAMMESADPRQRDHLTATVRQHGPRRPRVPGRARHARGRGAARGRADPPKGVSCRSDPSESPLVFSPSSSGSSLPPRTPTTSASASSSGAPVPIVRRGAMRFTLQLAATFFAPAAGSIVGTLLLRREPNWQALGVLATLLAVGVALEKCQALRRQGDG
jgi:hypothetical protein